VDGYVAASRLADAASLIPAPERLQRALKIAIGIGDTAREEQVRDAMAELAARVNEPWGWVTLFDTFEEQTKIKLTAAQHDAVVAALEAHMTEVARKPEGVEPLTAFPVAARLVRHYQRLDRQAEADRVVRACGQAVERRAARADHTLAFYWLDQVYQYYRINGLDEDAKRVQIEARRRGELARHEASETVEEVEPPPEHVEQFLNDVTDGGMDNAIGTIVGQFQHAHKADGQERMTRGDGDAAQKTGRGHVLNKRGWLGFAPWFPGRRNNWVISRTGNLGSRSFH
jgi:hypothetical protein